MTRYAALLSIIILGPIGLLSFGSPAKGDEDAWRKQLLDIAQIYEKWGRVDRVVRFSPEDCRAPAAMPISYRVSKSDDEATHGRKLYSVFAKTTHFDDGFARLRVYLPPKKSRERASTARQNAPIGQVIVKEAHQPVEITPQEYAELNRRTSKPFDGSAKMERSDDGGSLVDCEMEFRPIAKVKSKAGDKYYRAGPISGLFVMMKLDPSTSGTDQGWVYATLDETKKNITALGRIESCMNCHKDAPHDRLFGLPLALGE